MAVLLVLFGGLYASTLNSYGMFMWDEAEYASIARSVARGEGFSIGGHPNSLRPPLLPLAVAATMLLSHSHKDTVLKSVTLAFALLTLFVVYWCVTLECDRPTGLVAASFLGLFPVFWTSTPLLLTEIPFMALFTASVLFFYSGLHRSPRYFHYSWLCVGLSFLTRYTGLLFFPIAAGFLIVALLSRVGEVRDRIRNRNFLISPLWALGILLPWLIRQQITFGDALIGFRQAVRQLPSYIPGVSMPWYFYAAHLPGALSPILILFLLLGIATVAWIRDRFGLHCLFVFAGIILSLSLYRYKEMRLATSALPFMAVVAALGLTKQLPSGPLRPPAAAVLVLLLTGIAGLNFVATRATFRRTVTLGYPSFLSAMKFLRSRSGPSAVVIGASVPQIVWYADRRAIDFPDEAQFKTALESADWVVVTNFERGQRRYVARLTRQALKTNLPPNDGQLFWDQRFLTVVLRASWLRDRL
jgi:4-amino-4-deoxy-L-arabinose transferase-like glycosyltransferase